MSSDNIISAADIMMMQKFILTGEPLKSREAGDINSDGLINICDLCLLKNMILSVKSL